MEKEKHGYLLTGERRFEEGYEEAVTEFYTYNGYLAVLLARTPAQAELLANVRADLERWIDTIGTPEMRAKEEGKDVVAMTVSNNGDELTGQIRQTIGDPGGKRVERLSNTLRAHQP